MFRRFFCLACIGILAVAMAARAEDFEIDCTLVRGSPHGQFERTATPSKVTKSGEEGRFSDMRQVQAGRWVNVVGREVRVTALSTKDGRIQVEVRAEESEVAGPNNLPQMQGATVRTSAIVRPGDKLKVEFRKKHWVEITVRKAK
jgi:hypothetical protein